MELKTKYQYTYFIYPYLIEQKNYANYIYGLLRKKQCKLKIFDRKKDVQIDSYFMPKIKDSIFWTLGLGQNQIKAYEKMDTRIRANILSQKPCVFFEYSLEQDIPAKIGEQGGIFFDITKCEIICFSTGVCFLLIKTTLSQNDSFENVLNFNYKFRDIQSKIGHTKEYENIKIQTEKLNNMQNFEILLKNITGQNLLAKQINLDTDRLITYSYVCLEQNSWNENTDLKLLEKEFEKYYLLMPASEQTDDATLKKELVYKEKYSYYGFSSNSTMLLTSASNIKNYTSLLFEYENEQLYHFIYNLHQKIYLKKLNYEFSRHKSFIKAQYEFIEFARKKWIYEVTNNIKGLVLEKYYRIAQDLDNTFNKLKNKYDLLYKEYQIEKVNKHNKWIIAIIFIIIIINIINIILKFK